MSDVTTRASKLKSVFSKVAAGALVPDNFGSCLLAGVQEGLYSKKRVASVLEVDETYIRKAGNNLKGRQMASVAKALIPHQAI